MKSKLKEAKKYYYTNGVHVRKLDYINKGFSLLNGTDTIGTIVVNRMDTMIDELAQEKIYRIPISKLITKLYT